jgi:hypothetical protein
MKKSNGARSRPYLTPQQPVRFLFISTGDGDTDGVAVGHAGDVVGNGAGGPFFPRLLLRRQQADILHEGGKQLAHHAPRRRSCAQPGNAVKMPEQEGFQFLLLGLHRRTEGDQRRHRASRCGSFDIGTTFDESVTSVIMRRTVSCTNAARQDGVPAHCRDAAKNTDSGQLFQCDGRNTRRHRRHGCCKAMASARLMTCASSEGCPLKRSQIPICAAWCRETTRMPSRAFPGQVQAVEFGVAFFQQIYHTQGLEVVFETPCER